jgi:flagellar hook-associated protein 3 FlgL
MRISTNSIFIPYGRNLENIQRRQYEEQVRLSSGRDIISLSDAPSRAVNAKNFSEMISRNEQYISNIHSALGEMQVTETTMRNISDNLMQIRQLAIDSNQTGNSGNLSNLGVYVKGLLEDLVKDANADFNGKYLFSGTKTTPGSVESADTGHHLPFELKEGQSTKENPSGLQIVFKGNHEDRTINKDEITTEKINVTSDDIFGGDGTEIIQTVIDLYNKLTYTPDGNRRTLGDAFTPDELDIVNAYQREIAGAVSNVDQTTSRLGSRITRLESIRDIMNSENNQLDEYRSFNEDTDVAKTTLDLRKAETALAYALQTGGRIISNSLFDFLR